jgi:hypothetical protein
MSGKGNGDYRKGFSGVIKHRETEKYYTGFGQWAPNEEAAMRFTNLSTLMEEAKKYQIKDCCEFVMSLLGQPGFHIFLPL